jgi:hypothetical protein
VPPLSHLTPYTPTKSNLYFDISSPTTLSACALYILVTFQVPNFISIFFRLGRLSKEYGQVQGFSWVFVTSLFFYGEELLAPRPTLEDHPLLAVRDCLFNIFAATLHIWRPSPPSATWGRAMPWWQGTHLTWIMESKLENYCRREMQQIHMAGCPQIMQREWE